MDKVRNRIEFIVAKRRNGTEGTATGHFFGSYQAVRG
jgi:replicative DNA helicase